MADSSSALTLLRAPFIFSQSGPLRTSQFVRNAQRFGLHLDAAQLRRLHHAGALSPLVVLTDRVVDACAPAEDEPPPSDSSVADLRSAQKTGRIYDPTETAAPAEEPLRFDEARASDPTHWWNGLLYSRWQLLNADRLRATARPATPETIAAGLQQNVDGARERRVALVVTYLEARYLPEVEPGWRRIRSLDDEEWLAWRNAFDATEHLAHLQTAGVTLSEVRDFAENLLARARDLDPTGHWSELIRRAPVHKWKSFTGDLALAMEQRLAAEILLRFYEDAGGELPSQSTGAAPLWQPLNDRIFNKKEPTGRLLMRLGVTAHPGAILIVEGETERRTAARILEEAGFDDASHLVQVVSASGVGKDLQMLAAATIAPLLGDQRPDAYDMLRPPCHLIAVVDAEGKYKSPAQLERERMKVVRSIIDVVKAQRDDVETEHLESLVDLRTWSGGTYEFSHYSDAELLAAITTVHSDPRARPSDADLLAKISHSRSRGHDLKAVWRGWSYEPPKPKLADVLWPVLRQKIKAANQNDGPMPELAAAVRDALDRARLNSQGSWVIGRHKRDS